ncbi:ATP-binding protein [Streptomyces sp. NPDC000151]|uniref:ATP-binding protein n=1 Tax=Streptomyces sp. NPDC000151 TaxID=3154244 RepID=UPI0033170B86
MAPPARAAWRPQPRRRAFDREPVAVCAAREFALDTLTDWGVAERHDDIQLCVSELATNALLHGGNDVRRFWVVLSAVGHVLRVEVRDYGPGMPRIRKPEDSSDSGRGLLLVSDCAEAWGIDLSEQSKAVWAEFEVRTQPVEALGSGRTTHR